MPAMPQAGDIRRTFAELGFVVLESVLPRSQVLELRRTVGRVRLDAGRGGARSLLRRLPEVNGLAHSPTLTELAAEALGSPVLPVKGTLFDKTATANWKLPFHQDTMIAVRARVEAPGFGAWSVKEGIPHVRAPAEVLARMVAIRLHLDDTPEDNGALRVVPGSHRLGRFPKSEIGAVRRRLGERTCPVPAGGAMLMSPLLLHASSSAAQPRHRRVLHIEYASGDLPAGLEWPESRTDWS